MVLDYFIVVTSFVMVLGYYFCLSLPQDARGATTSNHKKDCLQLYHYKIGRFPHMKYGPREEFYFMLGLI